MKKVIYIFHPYPKIGGADRSIIKLINGIKAEKIFFISIYDCKYKSEIKKKLFFIKLKSERVLLSIGEIRKIIKSKFDLYPKKKHIFISNQNFANLITIFALNKFYKIKTIIIERNHLNELIYFKNFYDFLKKIIILVLIKFFYKKATKVVGVSKVLSKDLKDFIKKDVQTIYNPALDKEVFKSDNRKFYKFLKSNVINILSVGFLEKQKDHKTLIKAFKIVNDVFPNTNLIIIGRGTLYNKLNKLIKKLNLEKKIKILTKINYVNYYYKKANLFVLTSIYEGFGNVIVEALKNRCPVITSNCKSGPSEIVDHGKFGDTFEVGNYKILASKIIKFINNPTTLKTKAKNSKLHLKKFSFKNNSILFNKLINDI